MNASEAIQAVATAYGTTVAEIVGPSHTRHLTSVRHIAMYVLSEAFGLSTPEIGEAFERDHTTVLYGLRKVRRTIDEQPSSDFSRSIEEVLSQCRPFPAKTIGKAGLVLDLTPEIDRPLIIPCNWPEIPIETANKG